MYTLFALLSKFFGKFAKTIKKPEPVLLAFLKINKEREREGKRGKKGKRPDCSVRARHSGILLHYMYIHLFIFQKRIRRLSLLIAKF